MKIFILFLAALFILLNSCATGVPEEEVAVVYYNLGNSYVELKKYKEAVIAFEKAIALNPLLVKATYNLARIYIEGETPEKGIRILEDLLKLEPENSIIRETLAYGYYISGKQDKAIEIYESILKRDPYNSNALHNASLLFIEQGNSLKAREYLEKLYTLSPKDQLLRGMGITAKKLGDNEKAIDLLIAYTQKYKDDFETLEILGDLYAEEMFYSEAIEIYSKVGEQPDSGALVHFKKARLLLVFIQDREKGLSVLETALAKGFSDKEKSLLLLKETDKSLSAELEKIFLDRKIISPGESLSPGANSTGEIPLEVSPVLDYY